MTDDLAARFVVFIVGCVVGFIIARLRCIEMKLDLLLKNKGEKGELNLGWLNYNNVMMFLVVMLVAYAAWATAQTNDKIKESVHTNFVTVCQGGEEVRAVQRQTVDAIFELATGSVVQPTQEPLTPAQVDQFNAYVDDVNKFRSDMYDKIKPNTKCEPYVSDDNVEPPTPDFPHIKRRP